MPVDDQRERRERTRLVVIGVVQIVWGALLLWLATGVALVWFVIGVVLVATIALNRSLAARLSGGDGRLPSLRTSVLTITGVLLVATGTAIVFDGLAG